MSLFGKIMAVVFLIWTVLGLLMMRASGDFYAFMRGSFVTVIVGYIVIIGFTVVAKKLVAAM